MIKFKKYSENDYNRIIEFLRNEYINNRNESSWLAQRFEDMEYRVLKEVNHLGIDISLFGRMMGKLFQYLIVKVALNAGCIYIMDMNIYLKKC